jgi:peptide/nickel transport system substrate-binding protein
MHKASIAAAAAATCLAVASTPASATEVREGGFFRVAFSRLDYVDPALSYTLPGWLILDATCARLLRYPDKPPPEGYRLVPEVAVGYPKISGDGKTHTFTLRSGFRFSDGTPVRASAFARAINRTLAPGLNSAAVQYTRDIAGATDVLAGKAQTAKGVIAQGNTLVVRFTRPMFDFPAKTTMPFFCAVPPALPSDPEGYGVFPGSGPYTITEYRPGERVTLRRNRFYNGSRPHHVDGFNVDLVASPSDVLDLVERGEADWGYANAPTYFASGRDLVRRYGVNNKGRFYLQPGLVLRYLVFNHRRGPFRRNPALRGAVGFALDRRALVSAISPSPLSETVTDQFLPHGLPAYRDADIFPLRRPDLARARKLAGGNTRNGKVALYVFDVAPGVSMAQLVAKQLEPVGLDVEIVRVPPAALYQKLLAPGEPWDMAMAFPWGPDFLDPFTYINTLYRFAPPLGGNVGGFDSPTYTRLMNEAARLRGAARDRAYGELDIRLARDAVPALAISHWNEPTLVSKRVGCIVLRPALDMTAVCLK